MEIKPLIVEKTIHAPISKVWEALTNLDQMREWYFDIATFEPKVGFEFTFYGGSEARRYKHLCRITEVIENKKLAYTWRYEDYPGESLVSFELTEEGSGDNTLVRITHSGISNIQAGDNKDFAIESFTGGWNYILDTSLRKYVEAQTEPIIIERTFNASVAKLWEALTDADKMRQWYIPVAHFEPVVGFEFQFVEGGEARKYVHRCKVIEVIQYKKLAYTWNYEDYPADTIVTFELFDEGSKTRLKLTHSGVETIPTTNTDFSVENHKEGWTYLIDKALRKFVEAS